MRWEQRAARGKCAVNVAGEREGLAPSQVEADCAEAGLCRGVRGLHKAALLLQNGGNHRHRVGGFAKGTRKRGRDRTEC